MEAVRELSANGMNTYIRKEAYCHTHMPEPSESVNFSSIRAEDQNDSDGFSNDEDSESSFSDNDSNLNSKKRKKSLTKKSKKLINLKENSYNEATLSQRRQIKAKMKKARRILAEKRSACPTVSIPTIPAERLTEIAQLINIPKRNQFVQRLLGYWTLKRESRNGVPLLRRLQVSHANSCKALKNEDDDNEEHKNEQTVQLKAELKEMYRLRQDLERARILIELIRKREKIKREAIRNLEQTTMLQINPFNLFLDSVLNILKSKDVNSFFIEPVDINEVHDYLQFIERPMSFHEMKRKIDKFEYISFDDFEQDFNQIIENCTIYNEKHTIYFKAAIKLKEQCKAVFKQARNIINETGYDQKKGIHHPDGTIGANLNEFLKRFEGSNSAQELFEHSEFKCGGDNKRLFDENGLSTLKRFIAG
ncbi:hypothetical protein RND71_044251 [Anisodus tanguticus]|uniref:Bromo domain-containing protein n=1 Tax=Anisodus tanguticus TaxID=243964 RepID=A0AAE1UT73_9SOLA|nr:hypothetical protein RND71_044251 [Anisodus tanguticus]